MTNPDSPAVKPKIALWNKYLTKYKGINSSLAQKIIEALKKGEVVYIRGGKIVDAGTDGATKIDLKDGLSQKEAKALGLTAKQADEIAAQGWALKEGDDGFQTGDSAKIIDAGELAKFDTAIQKFADANGWSFEEALQAYYADNTKFGRIDTKARKESRVKTEAELLKGLKKVKTDEQFAAYIEETLNLQDNNPVLTNLKAYLKSSGLDFSKKADQQKAIAYIVKLASGSEWSKDFQVKVLKFAQAIQTQYKGQLDLSSIKAWAPTAKAYGDVKPAAVVNTGKPAEEPAKQSGTAPSEPPKAGEPEKADNVGSLNDPAKPEITQQAVDSAFKVVEQGLEDLIAGGRKIYEQIRYQYLKKKLGQKLVKIAGHIKKGLAAAVDFLKKVQVPDKAPDKVAPPPADAPQPAPKPVVKYPKSPPVQPAAPPAKEPLEASTTTVVIAPTTVVNVDAKKAEEKKAAELAKQAADAADTRKQEAKQPIETAKGLIGKLEKADNEQIKAAIAKVESSYGKEVEFKQALQTLNNLIEVKQAAIIKKEEAVKALAVEQAKAQALAKDIEGRKLNAKPVLEKARVLQKKYEARGSKKSVEIAGQIKAAIALVESSITTGKRFKKYLKALQTFVEKKETALNEAVKQDAKKAHGLRKKALESLKKEFKYSDLMKKLEAKMPKTEAQIEAINEKLGEVKVALLSGVDFKVRLGDLKAAFEAGQKKLGEIGKAEQQVAAKPKSDPKPDPTVVKKVAPQIKPKEVFFQVQKKLEEATTVEQIEVALVALRKVPEKDISFYTNITEAMKKAEATIALLKKYSTPTNEYVKAAAVELQKQALECLRSACAYPSPVGGGSDAQRLDSYLKQIEIIAGIESQNLSPAKAYDAYSKQMPSSNLLNVYINKILPKLSQGIKLQQEAQAAQVKKATAQKKISEYKLALPKLLEKLGATENKKLIAFGKKLKKCLTETNVANLNNYEQLLQQAEANLSQWVKVARKKMPVQYAIYRLKTDNGIKVINKAKGIPRFIQGWMKVFDGVELSGNVKLTIKIKSGKIEILGFEMNGFEVSEVTKATEFLPKAVDQKLAKIFLKALLAKVKIKGLKNGTYNLPLNFTV